MKLYYSAASPFARKVQIAAHELGLGDRLTLVTTNPFEASADLVSKNPLSQVPALILDDGTTLYDSAVICDYLNELGQGQLFPTSSPQRWTTLRWHALANGMTEAAVKRRIELTQRPQNQQSESYLARQRMAVSRGLDNLEQEAADLGRTALSIAHCAVAALLGYLDLRFADDRWRDNRPALAGWFEQFSQRPSMRATAPAV
jgi:glutathione S-transferase